MEKEESATKKQKLEEGLTEETGATEPPVEQVEAEEETVQYTAEDLALGNEFLAAIVAGDLVSSFISSHLDQKNNRKWVLLLQEKSKEVLDKGADLCFSGDELGRTPLHYAAEHGHMEIVEWLLSEKHPYNLTDKKEITAGELALNNKHTEVYTRLVDEGTRTEVLIRVIKRTFGEDDDEESRVANEAYLSQKLHYDDNKLMDENDDAVMMGWEGPLMVEHAKVMCPKKGLNVINVGFGLGLIDTELQKYEPKNHYIIEAHPDVYAHMLELGWDKKPGVKILFGRWQDMVPQLDIAFDGVFFDTYGGQQ